MTVAEQDWRLWHILNEICNELWDRNECTFTRYWDEQNEQNCYNKSTAKTDSELTQDAIKELPF